MCVLIISSLADEHVTPVMRALAERNCQVELLDLSLFPQKLTLTLGFNNGQHCFRLSGSGANGVDFDRVRAVWWRRPQQFCLPASVTDPVHQRFAISDTNTAFQGLYLSIGERWVNPPLSDAAANHKPWQLRCAQEIGLEIPETLMTNDPDAVRSFYDSCNGDVIYKQFLALPDAWRETRRLEPGFVQADDNLRLCPVIFQRRVDAIADLRVIIVGETVFAASVAVDQLAYDVDVRMNPEARYVPYALSAAVEQQLVALMHRLGLVYGAIDMRVTNDGRYIFLEVNPAGQFLYVEEATGQPIAAALAAELARDGL
jgi:hypothetical protein